MLRGEVLREWEKLKSNYEQIKTYLTFYRKSPFFLLTPNTPSEMIKKHEVISSLLIQQTEKKELINLNELGMDTKNLQSIWLNYSYVGKVKPQQVVFASDYSKGSWSLYPQNTSALELWWGRKIYFLSHSTVGVESEETRINISAQLVEEKRESEKDYQHTLHLKSE